MRPFESQTACLVSAVAACRQSREYQAKMLASVFRGKAKVVHRPFDDPPRLAREVPTRKRPLGTIAVLPLTAAVLFIAVSSLAFRAGRHRGYGPFVLGLAAAMLSLTGKFIVESGPAMYMSAGLLFAASTWNAWPRRTAASDSATLRAAGLGQPLV